MHPDFGTNVQGPAQWPRMYDGLCPTKSKSNLPIHTHRFAHYCKIPLTQGKFAKVDPDDYTWLAQFRWHSKINEHAAYAYDRAARKYHKNFALLNFPNPR
jgi:hypothetical protein